WLNLTSNEIDALHVGGLMHDIGKIAIPDQILRKPGALTREEYELMKQHPTRGAEILAHVSFPWDVLPIVKYHHERWDGKGYPEGLRGEEIPFLARIVAVADAFHAMISDRAYRPALSLDEAVRRIWAEAGKQFDPNLVPLFAKMVESQSIPLKVNE
ncbi:MAG TPA: HD-GYP domain-containing protein, partial [Armatimonadetes bacterium]|nr:HD-GYP domain-containing protein [Armatimonadota bacterium]